MTLVEILIAIVIVAVTSIVFYSAAVFTLKQSHMSMERAYALETTKGQAARLRSSKLTNLIKSQANMDNPSFERTHFGVLTGTKIYDTVSPRKVSISHAIELTGFGGFTDQPGNISNVFNITLPARSAAWKKDQYAGSMITIISGAGQNQIGRVVSHDASTAQGQNKSVQNVKIIPDVSLTAPDLSSVWTERPDSTSNFLMNYGITANIKTTWDDGKKTLEQTVYVPY